jgi:hypothetical protein
MKNNVFCRVAVVTVLCPAEKRGVPMVIERTFKMTQIQATVSQVVQGRVTAIGLTALAGFLGLDWYDVTYYCAVTDAPNPLGKEINGEDDPWRVFEVDGTDVSRRRISLYQLPTETTERLLTISHPKNGTLVRARRDKENVGWVQLPSGYWLPEASCGVRMLYEVPPASVPPVMTKRNYFRRRYRAFDHLAPRNVDEPAPSSEELAPTARPKPWWKVW